MSLSVAKILLFADNIKIRVYLKINSPSHCFLLYLVCDQQIRIERVQNWFLSFFAYLLRIIITPLRLFPHSHYPKHIPTLASRHEYTDHYFTSSLHDGSIDARCSWLTLLFYTYISTFHLTSWDPMLYISSHFTLPPIIITILSIECSFSLINHSLQGRNKGWVGGGCYTPPYKLSQSVH